jgi:hypothetical protein
MYQIAVAAVFEKIIASCRAQRSLISGARMEKILQGYMQSKLPL